MGSYRTTKPSDAEDANAENACSDEKRYEEDGSKRQFCIQYIHSPHSVDFVQRNTTLNSLSYTPYRGTRGYVIIGFVCLFVCSSVCQPLCAKTSERICMKFSGMVGNGPMNNRLIRIRIATLVRRALVEVCTIPVFLVYTVNKQCLMSFEVISEMDLNL